MGWDKTSKKGNERLAPIVKRKEVKDAKSVRFLRSSWRPLRQLRLRPAIFWLSVIFLLIPTAVFPQTTSQAALRITAVDDSGFPTIRLNVSTLTPPGGPWSDLTGLSLRENSIPVAYEILTTTVGLDLTFVIDANNTMLAVDDNSGQTRWQKIQGIVSRYADQLMDQNGLDHVSIILPDDGGVNGRFLLQNESDPAAVIAAIENIPPLLVNPTPLNAMMLQALALAEEQAENGRFQAILLLTDAGQIQFQLAFDDLVAQAQETSLPLFVGILGAQADPDERFRANRLAGPTLASSHHLPTPEAADPLFQMLAAQREQFQLVYESLLRRGGRYPLALARGEATALTWLELLLEPPTLEIRPPELTVRRIGAAHDSQLTELQPTRQLLPLLITWPDNKPREIVAFSWSVNGRLQPPPESPIPDERGQLRLEWDVQAAAAGDYILVAELLDEFGFAAASDPLTMMVVEERPLPPTPTPEPSPTPTPEPLAALPDIPDSLNPLRQPWPWLLFAALLALLWWRWRRRRLTAEPELTIEPMIEPPVEDSPTLVPLVPYLQPWSGEAGGTSLLALPGDNVSLGRETAVADLIFPDPGVSRLHARIIRQGDDYWLYDEGSAEGTFHNYQRLGLSPAQLQDGDQIGLGRVQLRFYLRPATDEEE